MPSTKTTATTFVARDKTAFDRHCRRSWGYQIGPKGREQWFADFDDALRALHAMPWPYWRRPSATSGVFGIVTARRV